MRKYTDKSFPEKKLDCTVQSILKNTKPIKVVLEQDWRKTFSMTEHSRQSRELLINSLILILSYYMGLNFLIALGCVQIKPGIRRSKVFLMLLRCIFISFLVQIIGCLLKQIFQYFPLLYLVNIIK